MTDTPRAEAPLGALKMLRTIAGSAVFPAIAFLGAGRLDWPRGWIYAVLFVAFAFAGTQIVDRANPGLLKARSRGFRKDTKGFDRVFYVFFLPLMVIYPLLAGIDAVRFAWAPLPGWTMWPGVLLFLAGSAFTTWALVLNRHAEGTVRIQSDPDHVVITDGPYRIVRHPIYVGTMVGLPAVALVLGSAWALLPMALVVIAFVWRTALEDRTLRQELAGYEAYVGTTPYRLVPGIW
jgi:protein-S-isoprenylcysteine O-methyltransferase Ste14